jgi:hypothetical protein
MEKYVESFDKAEIVILQFSDPPLCLNKVQVQGEVAGQMYGYGVFDIRYSGFR